MTPLWLLLRSRVHRGRNALSETTWRQRLVGTILILGSAVVFLSLFLGARVALEAVRQTGGEALGDALAERVVFGLLGFLLLGSLPFVSGTLLSPGDLSLSATFPIRRSTLSILRLIEGVEAATAQFVVLGLPILAASLTMRSLTAAASVAMPIVLCLLVILPPLGSSVVLLLAARMVGVRRARTGVGLTSVVLAVGACFFAVSETAALSSGGDWKAALASSVRNLGEGSAALQAISGIRGVGPLFGCVLVLASLVGLLGLAGTALGESVVAGDGIFEAEPGAGKGPDLYRRLTRLVPASEPVRAVLEKDLRYIARDLTLLSQLGVPIILYLVPFVLSGQARQIGAGSLELLGLSAFTVAFIAYMFCSILGLSSVGLEGSGYGLLRAAPLTAREFLQAKWWLSFLPSSALSLLLAGVAGIAFRAPAIVWATAPIALLFGCGSLCGIEVGISGLFPRFAFENPAHRASLSALIWGFVAASAYGLVALPLLVAVAFGYLQAPADVSLLLIVGASGAFLLISILAALVPMRLAAARLERYSES